MEQLVFLPIAAACQHFVSCYILTRWEKAHKETDAAAPYAPSEAQKQGIQKHQAVFSLDYDTWDQIKELLDLKESIIPHRKPTQEETNTSWHG